jgi:hypothetical protein
MTPRKRPGFAATFPPRLHALLDQHAQQLAAALIDATGPHAARVTLLPAICSNRADGTVTWSIVHRVDLVLPDIPHRR